MIADELVKNIEKFMIENNELKAKLENAIVPSRFVYSITGGAIGYYSENYVFATEEEAHQNLKELEGK